MSGGGLPIPVGLHICGITNDGRLWHASRPRDDTSSGPAWGPWSPWEEVKAKGAGDVGPFVSVSCAIDFTLLFGKIHVCGVTEDGTLWYTSRVPPDDWQPFVDLKTRIPGNWATFDVQKVAIDTFFFDVFVIALTASGEWRILHSGHLFSEDKWTSFEDVTDPQRAGAPGSFTTVSCADVSVEVLLHELHVCGMTEDGTVWHTLRESLEGSWLPFGDVEALSRNTPGPFTDVSIAQGQDDPQTIDQNLHVFALAGGDLWHTVRFLSPPAWQANFDRVKELAGNDPGSFGSISAANIGGDLHVCGVTKDGKLWHTMRVAANPPQWQPFEDITAAGGGPPGSFNLINVAVDFVPPGPSGADITCQIVKQNIASDRKQIQMLQQRNPNDPGIAGLRKDIAKWQAKGRTHQPPCPPKDIA